MQVRTTEKIAAELSLRTTDWLNRRKRRYINPMPVYGNEVADLLADRASLVSLLARVEQVRALGDGRYGEPLIPLADVLAILEAPQ